jgi:hypothetical protein
MRQRIIYLAAVALVIFSTRVVRAADSQAQFNELYGEQAKKVIPKDAAAFAEQLIKDASGMTDDPAMADFMVNKAMEFWQRAVKGPDKDRVGQAMLRNLRAAGEKPWSSGKYSQAAEAYQKASTVAKAIKSPDAPVMAARLEIAKGRADAEKKVTDLETKLKAAPKDPATLKKLVLLMTLDLNNPLGAEFHLDDLADPVLKKNIPMAAKDPYEIPLEKAKDLATWYKSMTAGASAAGKATAYERMTVYGLRFLKEHQTKDAGLVSVRKLVDEALPKWQDFSLLPESLSSFIGSLDFSLEPDALGTWKVKSSHLPSIDWTYIVFGKNGTCATVYLAPRNETYALPEGLKKVESDICPWVTKGNQVSLDPDSKYYPSFPGFPYPTGNATGPVKCSGATVTLEKVIPGSFQMDVQKYIDMVPSTRIPGTWRWSVETTTTADSIVAKTFFFWDDGTAIELYELANKGDKGTRKSIFKTTWEIRGQELLVDGKQNRFPYPLRKEGTQGNALGRNWRNGKNEEGEIDCVIKLEDSKPVGEPAKKTDEKN